MCDLTVAVIPNENKYQVGDGVMTACPSRYLAKMLARRALDPNVSGVILDQPNSVGCGPIGH